MIKREETYLFLNTLRASSVKCFQRKILCHLQCCKTATISPFCLIFRKIKLWLHNSFFLKIGTKRAAKSDLFKFDLTAVSFYLDNISNKAHDKLLVLIISYFHKKHKVFSRHENDFMVLSLIIFTGFVHSMMNCLAY